MQPHPKLEQQLLTAYLEKKNPIFGAPYLLYPFPLQVCKVGNGETQVQARHFLHALLEGEWR